MSYDNEKVQKAIDSVIDSFNTGKAVKVAAIAALPAGSTVPSDKWSFFNRMIMLLEGTEDARGYRQWQQAGRQVRQGAKAFAILAPRIVHYKDPETDEDRRALRGFVAVPVFRLEDTDGDPLPSREPATPPPLADVAARFGLQVRYDALRGAWGSFNTVTEGITLATHDARVFWHELAHAAHQRVRGCRLEGGQNPEQEIIAEFVAAVIARIYNPEQELGLELEYIDRYAKARGLGACQSVLALMKESDLVLKRIFDPEDEYHDEQDA